MIFSLLSIASMSPCAVLTCLYPELSRSVYLLPCVYVAVFCSTADSTADACPSCPVTAPPVPSNMKRVTPSAHTSAIHTAKIMPFCKLLLIKSPSASRHRPHNISRIYAHIAGHTALIYILSLPNLYLLVKGILEISSYFTFSYRQNIIESLQNFTPLHGFI